MNVITNNSKDDNTVFIYYLNANLGKFIFLIKDKKITASYFERSIFGPNKEG